MVYYILVNYKLAGKCVDAVIKLTRILADALIRAQALIDIDAYMGSITSAFFRCHIPISKTHGPYRKFKTVEVFYINYIETTNKTVTVAAKSRFLHALSYTLIVVDDELS
jgi:hypothetical protein